MSLALGIMVILRLRLAMTVVVSTVSLPTCDVVASDMGNTCTTSSFPKGVLYALDESM